MRGDGQSRGEGQTPTVTGGGADTHAIAPQPAGVCVRARAGASAGVSGCAGGRLGAGASARVTSVRACVRVRGGCARLLARGAGACASGRTAGASATERGRAADNAGVRGREWHARVRVSVRTPRTRLRACTHVRVWLCHAWVRGCAGACVRVRVRRHVNARVRACGCVRACVRACVSGPGGTEVPARPHSAYPSLSTCVRVRVCVRACVRACVRVRVSARSHTCAGARALANVGVSRWMRGRLLKF